MKKFLYILLAVIVIASGAVIYLANYMLESAVNPSDPRRHQIEGCFQEVYNAYPEMQAWHDSLVEHGLWRDTVLLASDGSRRHGLILQHDSLSTGVTVMLHGHNDNAVRMMRYAYLHYAALNRDVILPDHFGHGESDGNHIRFGWLDRLDISQLWLPAAHNAFPTSDILVHGLSMGGALTMYTSGEPIADSLRVIGFIEDCGYNSIWDQLSFQLKQEYGLPSFPLVNVASWLCGIKYGWKFSDGDVRPQLARCTKPMFFIHGDADSYVPSSMVMINYEAKTQGYKELWVAPGSDHACSLHEHWDEYVQRCQDYIDRISTLQ